MIRDCRTCECFCIFDKHANWFFMEKWMDCLVIKRRSRSCWHLSVAVPSFRRSAWLSASWPALCVDVGSPASPLPVPCAAATSCVWRTSGRRLILHQGSGPTRLRRPPAARRHPAADVCPRTARSRRTGAGGLVGGGSSVLRHGAERSCRPAGPGRWQSGACPAAIAAQAPGGCSDTPAMLSGACNRRLAGFSSDSWSCRGLAASDLMSGIFRPLSLYGGAR